MRCPLSRQASAVREASNGSLTTCQPTNRTTKPTLRPQQHGPPANYFEDSTYRQSISTTARLCRSGIVADAPRFLPGARTCARPGGPHGCHPKVSRSSINTDPTAVALRIGQRPNQSQHAGAARRQAQMGRQPLSRRDRPAPTRWPSTWRNPLLRRADRPAWRTSPTQPSVTATLPAPVGGHGCFPVSTSVCGGGASAG
jgi:hypothetical protein